MKLIAIFLFLAGVCQAQEPQAFVVGKYLAGNEIIHTGIIRIYCDSGQAITISLPLVLNVTVLDTNGKILTPVIQNASYPQPVMVPEELRLKSGFVAEVPIENFSGVGQWDTLDEVIHSFAMNKIAKVTISFSIQVEKLGVRKVSIDIPASEVRRLIGHRAGG